MIRVNDIVKNSLFRTYYRKTRKFVLLSCLWALLLGPNQVSDMLVLHQWSHGMIRIFLAENGGTVFLQKEKRVVKWVMRFVFFRIPVFCSLFSFTVRLWNYHQSVFYSFSFRFRSGPMWKMQGWYEAIKSQQILPKGLRYVFQQRVISSGFATYIQCVSTL